MKFLVRPAEATDVGRLMPLWISMVEHHRAVAGGQWPVRDAGEAWSIRRRQYLDWLADGSGILFVADPAEPAGSAEPVGYAMLRLVPSGATWDLGDQIGEVESVAVAAHARSAGVGTGLLAACRDELRRRGITHWAVGVVEANEAAVRFYERAGFRPYYREMLGTVDPEP
jgi:ribosomal protein S18 acetylase RimI-like enzyme